MPHVAGNTENTATTTLTFLKLLEKLYTNVATVFVFKRFLGAFYLPCAMTQCNIYADVCYTDIRLFVHSICVY